MSGDWDSEWRSVIRGARMIRKDWRETVMRQCADVTGLKLGSLEAEYRNALEEEGGERVRWKSGLSSYVELNFEDFVICRSIFENPRFIFEFPRLAFAIMVESLRREGEQLVTKEAFCKYSPLMLLSLDTNCEHVFDGLLQNNRKTLQYKDFIKYVGALKDTHSRKPKWEEVKTRRALGCDEVLLKHTIGAVDVTDAVKSIGSPGAVYLSDAHLVFEANILGVSQDQKSFCLPLASIKAIEKVRPRILDNAIELIWEPRDESGNIEPQRRKVIQFIGDRDGWYLYIAEMLSAYNYARTVSMNPLEKPRKRSWLRKRLGVRSRSTDAGSNEAEGAGVSVDRDLREHDPNDAPPHAIMSPQRQTLASRRSSTEKTEIHRNNPIVANVLQSWQQSIRKFTKAATSRCSVDSRESRSIMLASMGIGDVQQNGEAEDGRNLEMTSAWDAMNRGGAVSAGLPACVVIAAHSLLLLSAVQKANGRIVMALLPSINYGGGGNEYLINNNEKEGFWDKQWKTFVGTIAGNGDSAGTSVGSLNYKTMSQDSETIVVLVEELKEALDPLVAAITWENFIAGLALFVLLLTGVWLNVLDSWLSILLVVFAMYLMWYGFRKHVLGISDSAVIVTVATGKKKDNSGFFSLLNLIQRHLREAAVMMLKAKALLTWQNPDLTKKFIALLWCAALVTHLVPFRFLFLGVILYAFLINNLFRWFPEYRNNYDIVTYFWVRLPADPNVMHI